MAFLSDIVVDWYTDPRLITRLSPATSTDLQDLYDTLAQIQDTPEGQQFPNLINDIRTGGKQDLGAGTLAEIILTLNNAQFAYEQRATSLESGTVTTPDTGGTVLIDSTATFVTNGVVRGDLVLNDTDDSLASVLSVDSEIQLTVTSLSGGTDNDFDAADVYRVFEMARCEIVGGSLVAVDDLGATLDATFQAFGTQINYRAATSGTLISAAEMRKLIANNVQRRANPNQHLVDVMEDDGTTVFRTYDQTDDQRILVP